MSDVKYLYGAAVQGIQGFIFQTNELKDIVGASELVDKICTNEFSNFTNNKEEDSVQRAAGNIKHIFHTEEECKKTVREFPRHVMEKAPGITISQAVVKMEGNHEDFAKAVDELEKRLRTQRNKPMPSVTTGLMGIKRSNNSGYPLVEIKGDEMFDAAKVAKRGYYDYHVLCDKAFGEYVKAGSFPFNIEDITLKNDWIAIIHADGNGLGQIVQKVGKQEKDFKEFSTKLNEATKRAAQEAWAEVEAKDVGHYNRIPLRPVVLGGDDLTVICRADFAIEYVTAFMRQFEVQTEKFLGGILEKHHVFDNGAKKLTACAGVALIKSSYPFYYGYELAEALCSQAKKSAKKLDASLAPSCVMFHKVQDSFVESYAKIEERELTTKEGVSFKYGPYYVDDIACQPTVSHLLESVKQLDSDDGNKIKSHLRQWVSALFVDRKVAEQKKKRVLSQLADGRLKQIFKEATLMRETGEEEGKASTCKVFAYDMLTLASIKYQDTKTEETK